MSKVQLIKDVHYIALLLPFECKVLSSSVLNGGLSCTRSFLNLKVDQHAPAPWPMPEETLSNKTKALALPQPTTAMMTAASMDSLGYCKESRAELVVECWVTAGLSNVRRVGDSSDEQPKAGTINISLYINHHLSDTALVEALMMVTESKVTAIRDAGIVSPISGSPASGTGTDSHAVFCTKQGEVVNYCGKHTLIGELIGKAVLSACSTSIEKCMTN
ncbi:adenosylcobinamide amidohydrolase [Marinomonas atlantica]|uniref:adenosylcobinamide amidohydrolase n=1 Tax=Marinomonas atlantica TaxID=1806668 RepID=UPI00082E2B8D|nr:adenosylcobinamide amidohydrolase [Marinomonas atlantica]MCO4784752.1 adenosylcobinamide amidohydrolase [Marinomonas atlantica]